MDILKVLKKKKNITVTRKEHDEWHRKNGYENKTSKEHKACHKKYGIKVR